VAVFLVVLCAGAITSCSSGGDAKPANTSTHSPRAGASARAVAGEYCTTDRAGGRPVYFGAGSALAGYEYGTGSTGIVFASQSDGTACDWMPEAGRLAKLGYRTLAFDYHGFGASNRVPGPFSNDVNDAIEFLTSDGATSIVLVGASMGGTAVLAATAQTKTQPAAVIALSSPASYADSDALAAAPRITVPLLMLCGSLDRGFVGDVKDIYAAATATKHKQLVLGDTSAHGFQLVEAGSNSQPEPRAYAAYSAFLARYAPPKA
jgi:pimeloyl-ACP methyl ester carboxylesterase